MPDVDLTIGGPLWNLPRWAKALYNEAKMSQADDYDPWGDYGIFDVDDDMRVTYPELKYVETIYITFEHPENVEVWLVKKQ